MRFLALLLLAMLALAGCGGGDERAVVATEAAPTEGVKELSNVLDLRADFEADAGRPRLIVLLSPT